VYDMISMMLRMILILLLLCMFINSINCYVSSSSSIVSRSGMINSNLVSNTRLYER
jgi:hypothetical protein